MNLINIWNWTDKQLFADIVLPQQVDRVTLVNHILSEYGEYTPLCEDPSFFKNEIDNWFKVELDNFTHIANALDMQYNAIENYDRTEENSSNNTLTDKVSAFDTEAFSNDSEKSNAGQYQSHIHGNIGVTTSQQMIESEIHLRTNYDVYNIIAVGFFKKFMLHCL